MKLFLLGSMMMCSAAAIAQPKLITNATITTTTNVVAPEDDGLQTVQNQSGNGMAMFRNFGDGETKSTTYLKDNLVKTIVKTDMGRTTIIRNNETKLTTTLLEMMGRKTGFYVTDEEQAATRNRMDSMMQSRRKDSTAPTTRPASSENKIDVHYTEETKKIAGYVCKKAYIVTTRILGIKDSAEIWYTPEFKMNNLPSTGGMMGFNLMSSANGFDKVEGFVMAYSSNLPRGRKMTVEVNKIDLNKEVAAKEFDIPKDFEVKAMKDMQTGGMMGGPGGGGQIMFRGQ